ncbi:tachykinin-2 [Plakobranchus ocellatus]|uniref:Tachykinin-2 n=1 Tax=Plakobranchus ocellatus TaxID=259542 RepID=A0AAV4A5W2_9GAST|nr:tachykinin-2 [Plakobranchus ocellatus]
MAAMLHIRKLCWGFGVIALLLTRYACASNLDQSERMKDSLWLPVAEENLNDPGWTDSDPSKAMFQPSEVDDYSVNPEKIVVVDDGADTLGGQPEESSPRGAVDEGSPRASLRMMLRSIFSTLDNDRRSRQGLTAVNQVATKKGGPRGYIGSRGKRFMPGLESLLLAKYYQDAGKWKRQPHIGFHGSRDDNKTGEDDDNGNDDDNDNDDDDDDDGDDGSVGGDGDASEPQNLNKHIITAIRNIAENIIGFENKPKEGVSNTVRELRLHKIEAADAESAQ